MATALETMMHVGSAAREVAPAPGQGVPIQVPDFDTLYDDFADFVWRNARRLGADAAALDDVVQDVFLVAHRRLSELARPESLRAWMFSIVVRVVRDHRRRQKRKDPQQRSATPTVDPELLPDLRTNNPLAAAEQSDAVRLLHAMLNELDDAKREVFVLAELEELTEAEISDVLGENANTVHSRLRAARKDFDQAVLRHRKRDEWRLR
jgi:RNA polymerase sigma-70 factor (ECF subfamily)